jgi:hypothetical protein
MGLIAPALAWSARTAAILLAGRKPRRGAHGYLARSRFRIGLDQIRRLLRSHPAAAIAPWFILASKPTRGPSVV